MAVIPDLLRVPPFRVHAVIIAREGQRANALPVRDRAATGDGGTCLGDSGGPHFLGDSATIAGITVLGDGACQSVNRAYRIDTDQARAFLATQGVALP